MNKKQQTIETYNRTAQEMAQKFNKIGPRIADIDEVFSLVKKENPFVVEIGCGNGRDAKEITKKTSKYLGVDISENFIKIAKDDVPSANFEVADVESYEFPENVDVVFAFASLIHVPKESLENVLMKIYDSLNVGGVVRISMKYSDPYSEVVKEDEFGTRTYYFYSTSDIEKLCEKFKIIKNDLNRLPKQDWVETILIKE